MSLHDPAHVHALRYATEATKLYLMEQYRKEFPHLFQNATIQTRPATNADYYVPPSLVGKAHVVVRTALDTLGCLRMSCYPFKKNWDVCTAQDPPHWVPIGQHFELACQPACQDFTIHSEWVKGNRCILANPLKKMVASMPENLFEIQSYRHVFHGGLDVVDGELQLNQAYCEAYGLKLVQDECETEPGQSFLEFFIGLTPMRAAITARLKPHVSRPPAQLPTYLHSAVMSHQQTRGRKRTKRSVSSSSSSNDEKYNAMVQQIYKEIAVELVQEIGETVSEWSVKKFLRTKAPGLLVGAVDRIAAKLVIKQSMAVAMKTLGKSVLKAMAKSATVVAAVYGLYDLVMSIVEIMDPLDFNKFLTKTELAKINKTVDYSYYTDLPTRPELTPEFIWENNLLKRDEDETEKFQFMVAKTQEYLTALNAIRPEERDFEKSHLTSYAWMEDEKKAWNKKLFISFSVVAICFVFLFIEWIDVWVCILLFAKMYYGV